MDNAFEEGIRLFNNRKFFEAHEALEAVWLKAQDDEKVFLHGLIQIAAAFHHETRGNLRGCRLLLEKGLKKLERFGGAQRGIKLDSLRGQLALWLEFLRRAPSENHPESPPAPRIDIEDRA